VDQNRTILDSHTELAILMGKMECVQRELSDYRYMIATPETLFFKKYDFSDSIITIDVTPCSEG
jgi:hypothetical protein